jgi:hypothetical protein
MNAPQLQQPAPTRKPLSIAVQIWAVELVAAMNFRHAFPGMRESEVERTKRALKDAAGTLSQLTDW